MLPQILETIMLICFGLSWPINAIKSYRAGTAKGMSLPFICLILFGYVAGITAKIILIEETKIFVLIVYILNLLTVGFNLFVYFRNRHLDKVRENKASDIKPVKKTHKSGMISC